MGGTAFWDKLCSRVLRLYAMFWSCERWLLYQCFSTYLLLCSSIMRLLEMTVVYPDLVLMSGFDDIAGWSVLSYSTAGVRSYVWWLSCYMLSRDGLSPIVQDRCVGARGRGTFNAELIISADSRYRVSISRIRLPECKNIPFHHVKYIRRSRHRHAITIDR